MSNNHMCSWAQTLWRWGLRYMAQVHMEGCGACALHSMAEDTRDALAEIAYRELGGEA